MLMFHGDFALFLGQLLRRPHEVVALAPSSPWLCAEIVAGLSAGKGPVIELGAGTGMITQAILERGFCAGDLHAIEMNPEFCEHLKDRFTGLNLYPMSAQDVGALPVRGAQAVVSGLPLLSMPIDVQRAILTGSFTCLAPGASFVQFTYGPTPPIAQGLRRELALDWVVSDRIWRNMPPARVYRFFRNNPTH